MRILEFDLDRYGAFTGRKLAFREDAKLHVVYGPNEAGKSTSLAAVTDLLFGIERQTKFDFLHNAKDMQIGARLRDSKGTELSFCRRKNKPQLRGIGDAALPDDALVPFLGGLSRDVFKRAFGLDAESLRKSSEELKQSDGELGAALFSAASGLRGFADVQTALEQEADGIFAERRSQNRIFYQALDRYENAKKQLREHETRAGDLKQLRDQLAARLDEISSLRDRRAAISTEIARLDRLKRAAPVLRAIDEAQSRLSALGGLPDVRDGLGAALLAAIDRLADMQETVHEAETLSTGLDEELAAIVLDPAILELGESIERLQVKSGEYRKAMQDLPGVERELASVTEALSKLAARLGLQDVPTLLQRQPDDASRASVTAQLERGRKLRLSLDACETARKRESVALELKKSERSHRRAVRDPMMFRERLDALSPIMKRAEACHLEGAELAGEAAQIRESAERLSPAAQDLDRLASVSFPTVEMIKSSAARWADADASLARAVEDLTAADAELDRLTQSLNDLAAGGPIPTPEAIRAKRQERDAHWALISRTIFGPPDALDPATLSSTVASFEIAKAEADRLADDRAADATRVAAHAEGKRRLRDIETRIAAIRSRHAAATSARAALQDEWNVDWMGAGLSPRAPRDMLAWRIELDALLVRRDRWRQRQAQHRAQLEQIESARPALTKLIEDLDLAPMPGLPLPAVAQRVEREIAEASRAWEAAREYETLLADLERRAAASHDAEATARKVLEEWRAEFGASLPRIGLPASVDEAEAQAVLEAWRDVPAAETRLNDLRRRIEGIKRDARMFESEVQRVVSTVAADLDGATPDAVLRQLMQRVAGAREARTRSQEASRRVKEAQSKEARARACLDAAKSALAGLRKMAELPESADLKDFAHRLASRDEILRLLRLKREELANAADGREETALREALSIHDPDMAEHDAARLREEDRGLERAGNEAYAAHKELDKKLRSLETDVEAEVALQQRRGAETEMVDAARDWAVLSVGARMIALAIERQRLGRQEPLMIRAGELFATLTGGSYCGLGQAYDDDAPHIEGLREGRGGIRVTDMSEGTRDQLYLALRLAYVEDFARRAEPPPFLGDDLFASFDDARTAQGLRALAAISERVQPILFTHHGFVVESARRELDGEVDIISIG
ncbi:MAG: AAA family ATPase [Beijerinckiaceae bacterium]|nr:AAA family ATPase [Beijerinckiaceae bacterium]